MTLAEWIQDEKVVQCIENELMIADMKFMNEKGVYVSEEDAIKINAQFDINEVHEVISTTRKRVFTHVSSPMTSVASAKSSAFGGNSSAQHYQGAETSEAEADDTNSIPTAIQPDKPAAKRSVAKRNERLQSDINEAEEDELRRLESGPASKRAQVELRRLDIGESSKRKRPVARN